MYYIIIVYNYTKLLEFEWKQEATVEPESQTDTTGEFHSGPSDGTEREVFV